MIRKRVPLVPRPSQVDDDDHLSLQLLDKVPLGSSLNRYEVCLLSLSLAREVSDVCDSIIFGSYALHCLKWSVLPIDEVQMFTPLLYESVRKVVFHTCAYDGKLRKVDLILEAVEIVGKGFEKLGYKSAASWIYQRCFTLFAQTCVDLSHCKAGINRIHFESLTAIPDPALKYSHPFANTKTSSVFFQSSGDQISLFALRKVVLGQMFLQQKHGSLCHVGRLRAVSARRIDPPVVHIMDPSVHLYSIHGEYFFYCKTISCGKPIFEKKLQCDQKCILSLIEGLNQIMHHEKGKFYKNRKEIDSEMNLFLKKLQDDIFGTNWTFVPDNSHFVWNLYLPDLMIGLPIESIPAFANFVFVRRRFALMDRSRLACMDDPENFTCTDEPGKSCYVLNPGGDSDQSNVQSAVDEAGWTGRSGSPTLTDLEFISLIRNKKTFLYSGHGGGEKWWSGASVQRLCVASACPRIVLLMGCSSAKPYGDYASPFCTPFHYLIGGSTLVVGTLWDVLGRELDRMTIHIVRNCSKSSIDEIPKIVAEAKKMCKLKNISPASIVMYAN